MRCQFARDGERDLLPGKRLENQWMAAADPTHLDSECCAPFAQTQAPGAVLEQTSIPQLQVELPRGDLREMCDQPRALPMFLLGEALDLTF